MCPTGGLIFALPSTILTKWVPLSRIEMDEQKSNSLERMDERAAQVGRKASKAAMTTVAQQKNSSVKG